LEIYDVTKYGPHMRDTIGPIGWIAESGENDYHHRFGGSSWNTATATGLDVCDLPALLLTFDLRDPRLNSLSVPYLNELPICSFINSNIWEEKQVYEIIPDTHTVRLVSIDQVDPSDNDEDIRLHLPFPEKDLRLRAMEVEDYPLDEDSYWDNCDKFVNGSSFIRVLGPPIWLQWVEEERCECGLTMKYVCSIGYEHNDNPSGLIPDAPFFIGEGALYFFLCSNCLRIVVISQST
jgi:hypothetical protein